MQGAGEPSRNCSEDNTRPAVSGALSAARCRDRARPWPRNWM